VRVALLCCLASCATSGGLPDWVRNPYAEFSKEKYVVAVGSGRNLEAAKRDALNGIAAYLGVEINTTQGSEESETVTTENGERRSSGHLRAAESVNQIISQRLSSVAIERAHSQGATTYVLALLDKGTFLEGLSNDADNAAHQLTEGVKAASAENPPSRGLLLGLQAVAQRLEALSARIIALGGKVTPEVTVTLRNSLGFLARFDIVVPPPAAPVAGAAPGPACDENDPRLRKAVADMAATLGHGISVTFNLEQLPKGRAYCDDLFERHIGLLPKNLATLKERKPAIYAYGAPSLKRIDFDYDGTDQYSDLTFDRNTGVFRIVIGGRSSYPIPSDSFGYVFEKQYEAWVIAHFQGVEPEAVPAAEHALYYDYLTRLAWWGKGAPRTSRSSDDLDDGKGEVLLKMIRFAPMLAKGDAAATADRKGLKPGAAAREWLADQYEFFGSSYLHKPGPVTRAPATSAWKRAERAWIDWMNGAFDGLSDEKKKRLLPEMLGYTMPFNNDEGIVWNEFAYPGLKTYDMGMAIIDRWIKAGHPAAEPRRAQRDNDDKQLALFNEVVSPIKRNSQGSWSVETFERRKNWYFHTQRTEALRKRLLADVLARRDDAFTEVVFANLLTTSIHLNGRYAKDQRDEWADFLFYWRGVESDQRQWKVATRVMAEGGISGETKKAAYDEAVKLWRRYPWTRGTLLYLLAAARYEHNLIPWAEWARVFGAAISPREAAEFLDLGCRAVAALPAIWPALGKGWSRAEVLVPRLDRFIQDPLTRANNFQDPYVTLRDVVNQLREEKATGDIGRLHGYLRKRVADHPSEERELTTLLDMTK
jgi:hypothetical protein